MKKKGIGARKYLITGLLTAIPIWITWLIVSFLFRLIIGTGRPLVNSVAKWLSPHFPHLAVVIEHSWFQALVALFLVLCVIYLLGWLTSRVMGRRIIAIFENLLDKIPMVKVIYGGAKKLLEAFQKKPEKGARVVLINYPSHEMKAIGLVTKVVKDKDTGQDLAAVYVPTTPNPTSGFLEIVPLEDVIFTDWTVNDAMIFIVSGGAVGPDNMNYSQSVTPPATPPSPDSSPENQV